MKRRSPTTAIAPQLLRWYDAHGREMPWRAKGKKANPYHVLLSEFMLQQTGVSTVVPYFLKFIRRWPTLGLFAKADLEEVRAEWAGLGYYRRASFLHRCAQAIIQQHGGKMPQDEMALRELPGIGPYTAAALAAIAFNQPANVVDGNVERVVARLFAYSGKKEGIRERAGQLVPQERPGDYAQALMDLGATLCTPRKPDCHRCPIKNACKAFAQGKQENYPTREKKLKVPEKQGVVFIVQDKQGRVLLRKRPETGLYAGLWEFPSTPWETAEPSAAVLRASAPKPLAWKKLAPRVDHVFSHFKLTLSLRHGHSRAAFFPQTAKQAEYRWIQPAEFSTLALPSVMKKVWQVVERESDARATKKAA
jgi:A/G-specific adenine glycosylase